MFYMEKFDYNITENNIHIVDSYLVHDFWQMRDILLLIKESHPECQIFKEHSLFSLRKEWEAHNLLYDFHIKRERTKDVDLDIQSKPQWLYDACYLMIGTLYRLFHLF